MKSLQAFFIAAFVNFGMQVSNSQPWALTSAPNNNWVSIASSADGTKLVAANLSGVYLSTNSGATWKSSNVPFSLWASVASSADGTKLALASGSSGGMPILLSTNSGTSWTTSSSPALGWTSVASSADGVKLAATHFGGGVYTSTNEGGTWLQQPIGGGFSSIASSADGNLLVTCESSGTLVYNSTNGGATWISNSLPSSSWNSVASSADGHTLVVAGTYNPIYVSTNSGGTWQRSLRVNPMGLEPRWRSVACSADGIKIIAVCSYYSTGIGSFSARSSTNFGGSWQIACTTNLSWTTVASSADGAAVALAASSTGIYTSQIIPSTQLGISSMGSNLVLSWLVPSTNFCVQQSIALGQTDWSDFTNVPTLNLTNLQNQIILPTTLTNTFFRLKTP